MRIVFKKTESGKWRVDSTDDADTLVVNEYSLSNLFNLAIHLAFQKEMDDRWYDRVEVNFIETGDQETADRD